MAHHNNEVRKVVGRKNAGVVGKIDSEGQYFTVTAYDETGRNRAENNLRDSETFYMAESWEETAGEKFKAQVRVYDQ